MVGECPDNNCAWDSDVFKYTRLFPVIEDPLVPLDPLDYNDWVKGAMYLAGDVVMVDNKLYECCESCAVTPDLGLEMSCQWLAPRNNDSAWTSVPNPAGNNI